MEVVKGVIYDRGPVNIAGVKAHSYLVGIHLFTNRPIDNLEKNGETVVMGHNLFDGITEGLDGLTKYEKPYPMGDLSQGVLLACELDPANLNIRS